MSCPVCASAQVVPLLDLGGLPVFCNVQWATRAEAVAAARAPVDLSSCRRCGHVFNSAFDPKKVAYAPGYENSQHFSAVFRAYAQQLVEKLVERFDIRDRNVVDIGCGRGDLLRMIAQHGRNRGFGFDPSYDAVATAPDESEAVRISREYFTREQAAELQPALVCCRHVLEHVPDPIEFLEQMRESTTGGDSLPVFYLEVPNGTHLLRTGSAWDYIYEHVSYFSRASLTLALERAGFDLIELQEGFDGQFLCAFTRPRRAAGKASPISDATAAREAAVIDSAGAVLRQRLDKWRVWAGHLSASKTPTTVWGAGSKGVIFLNVLGISDTGPIRWVIDQSPLKDGRHVSGTGHVIALPDPAHLAGIENVVLMNSIYAPEVRARLDANGSRARLLAADGAPDVRLA
jgi:SAM-dependent methyltransferase